MAQPTNKDLALMLTLDDLTKASGWDKNWVLSLIDEDIIQPETAVTDNQRYFNSVQLTTIRRASRLRRDFDASPQAIGLILALLDELRPLRQLQRQVTVTRIIHDVTTDETDSDYQ